MWCMVYMVGKVIELAFQRIWPFVIWTSQGGVMTETLKTVPEEPEDARELKSTSGMLLPVGLPPPNVAPSVHTYLRDFL